MSAGLGGWSKCGDVIKAFPDKAASLKDATVIITGPTSGIGFETSIQLAVICGRLILAARCAEKASALIQTAEKRNGAKNITHIPCDLSSLESVKEFVSLYRQRAAVDEYPPLRCLVLNAGLITFSHQESKEVTQFLRD
jgi:NAD(P)-dependent dehydrogenase (short-subunit alcohol dehydrogenase family)